MKRTAASPVVMGVAQAVRMAVIIVAPVSVAWLPVGMRMVVIMPMDRAVMVVSVVFSQDSFPLPQN